jgi:hypothetical protein
MTVTKIKEEIQNRIKEINSKVEDIKILKNDINKLEFLLKRKEEESLMDFINVGDEYEVKGWVSLGNNIDLCTNDIFKIVKVNKKSLYIQVTKKHRINWSNSNRTFELLNDHPTLNKVLKISSSVFYNNFKSQISEKLDLFNKRNDILNSILEE